MFYYLIEIQRNNKFIKVKRESTGTQKNADER